MDVHLGGAVLVIDPQRPGHLGQSGQEAAIDGGEALEGFGLFALHDREGLLGQVADDVAEQLGIEDSARFAERAQGGTFAAQQLLHFRELTSLLDAAEAGEDWIEEVQQHQRGVLIEMEFAIAGAIALGRVVVKSIEKRPKDLEVLEPAKIRFLNIRPTLACHDESVRFHGR